jgi:hypothetical protein
MGLIELANFPVEDQLAAVAGRVNQNAQMDCVWSSEASCVEFWWPGTDISGDEIIDFVKGPSYVGGGNAAWSVGDVGHHFGIDVQRWPGDQPKQSQPRLVAAVRDYLRQGVPSLVTIPSLWNSQPTRPGYTPETPQFSTHCVVAYAIEDMSYADGIPLPSNQVWLMNPWHGVRQQVTVGWLQRRLCYGTIWPVGKFTTWRDLPAMPGYEDDGTQLRKKGSSVVFVKGFRKFALLHPELFTGVFADQEPLKNEYPFGNGSEQPLTYVKFVWTPAGGVRLEPNQLAA